MEESKAKRDSKRTETQNSKITKQKENQTQIRKNGNEKNKYIEKKRKVYLL